MTVQFASGRISAHCFVDGASGQARKGRRQKGWQDKRACHAFNPFRFAAWLFAYRPFGRVQVAENSIGISKVIYAQFNSAAFAVLPVANQ
jgi:hypothetical protein